MDLEDFFGTKFDVAPFPVFESCMGVAIDGMDLETNSIPVNRRTRHGRAGGLFSVDAVLRCCV